MRKLKNLGLSVLTFLVSVFTIASCGKEDSTDVIEAITSISIREGSNISLQMGETKTLHINYSPTTLQAPAIVWKSSDATVVSINSSDASIKANSVGIAIITASYNDMLSATCSITVTPIPVKSISIDIQSKTAVVGDQFSIKAEYEPKDASCSKLIWTSTASEVATVVDGKVTCVGAGTCQIIVQDEYKKAKATCDLIVESVKVESISLNYTEKELIVGESFRIETTILPENATDKQILWSSSSEQIAVVKDGVVSALSIGSCKIVASDKTGSVKNQCIVTVKPFEPEMVDLGLPSGTLWSNVNIDATAPEQYGGYYAWGEIVEKQSYSWKNYKFHVDDNYYMSKYSVNYNADFKTVLEAQDDVATVKLGNGWKIPTDEQMSELILKCEWVKSEKNGINGYIVKGLNGNTIFLPMAGRKGSTLEDAGSSLYYWTSSVGFSLAGYAQALVSSVYGVNYSYSEYRYFGYSVRPVAVNDNL